MCERASARMREKGLASKTISLKVRYTDFKTISRSKTLASPIFGTTEVYEVARNLFKGARNDKSPVRLVGVSLENLTSVQGSAEQLFLGQREKGWREATVAIDAAAQRFGDGAVRPARLFEEE